MHLLFNLIHTHSVKLSWGLEVHDLGSTADVLRYHQESKPHCWILYDDKRVVRTEELFFVPSNHIARFWSQCVQSPARRAIHLG